MGKWMEASKRFLGAAVVGVLFLSSLSLHAYAAEKLYDQVTTETVTKGVTYEKNRRLTAEGWQDIHVLKMDLNDPYITFSPVESQKEYGLKETVQTMIQENGAVAGVNADFFGLKGEYSASFGPVIRDGELISAGTDKNHTKNEYAAFFLDKNGNPFIDFFKLSADFYVNGERKLELASVNKITEMIYPVYFDRNAAVTTADLDRRFPGLIKLSVENGMITNISQKGETVAVPAYGYLIVVSERFFNSMGEVTVGMPAETRFLPSLDLNQMQTAIGGAGKILQNGQKPADAGLVISGRQPRTAIGISQDANTLILMVVDGRSHSIGATHDEMVSLMQEYGAYHAIHLDGGGSSTMVVKTLDEDKATIKNVPSDGAQRKVMNAVGIFNHAPVGGISRIEFPKTTAKAFVGNTIGFSVIGYDEYYRKLTVPQGEVQYSFIGEGAILQDNQFTPSEEGVFTISATWQGFTAVTDVTVMNIATIAPVQRSLRLSGAGDSGQISVMGVSTSGYQASVSSGITYTLSDSTLGTISGNTFTAAKNGSGYIKCTLGDASCYIAVSVGGINKPITSFETDGIATFSGYPDTVKGSVGTSTKYFNDGKKSLALSYTFAPATTTQAAYSNFKNFKISGEPTALKLSVYGNGSTHWLRGKIKDAKGTEYTLNFAQEINWSGTWQEVSVAVPKEVQYPISLESIYIAAVGNISPAETTVYFDKLSGVYPVDTVTLPEDTKIQDTKLAKVSKADDGAYYVNIVGRVSSGTVQDKALYDNRRKEIKGKVESGADLAIFAGKNDFGSAPSVDTIKWSSTYGSYQKPGLSVIQLTAAKGGLRSSNPAQWRTFKNDAINSDNPNVLFIMDKTPSAFSDPMEAQLFRSVLADIQKAGKEVIVISSSEQGFWSTMKDGVRYFNLPDMWTPDGKKNPNFTMLKLRINGTDMTYEIVKGV